MVDCERCGEKIATSGQRVIRYCDACQETFSAIEANGVLVEQASVGESYQIYVTDTGVPFTGGQEDTQVDALARAKYITNQTGLDALVKQPCRGTTWLLDEYLAHHLMIEEEVAERLQAIPDDASLTIVNRLQDVIES